MISRRIGKTAATVIGGGFICIQLAYQTGYLSIDWDKVTRDVRRAQRVVDSEISLTSDDFQTLTEKVLLSLCQLQGVSQNLILRLSCFCAEILENCYNVFTGYELPKVFDRFRAYYGIRCAKKLRLVFLRVTFLTVLT